MDEKQTITPEDVGKLEDVLPKLGFKFKSVRKKPSRKYRKGSKYDPIIEAFLKGSDKLVTVTIEGKSANYIRTQLTKRLEALNINNVLISVVNNVCYLEKTD